MGILSVFYREIGGFCVKFERFMGILSVLYSANLSF
jgi:hypothetical protein